MAPSDTSPAAQRMLDAHDLAMTPAEKADAVREAWRTARTLALAGLRLDDPDETDAQLEARWAERRLGPDLFRRALSRPGVPSR